MYFYFYLKIKDFALTHSNENYMLKSLFICAINKIFWYKKLNKNCFASNFIKIDLHFFAIFSEDIAFWRQRISLNSYIYFENSMCNSPKKFCIITPFN